MLQSDADRSYYVMTWSDGYTDVWDLQDVDLDSLKIVDRWLPKKTEEPSLGYTEKECYDLPTTWAIGRYDFSSSASDAFAIIED